MPAVDRVNRGRLGPKDLFGSQANASPDRLTAPLVRRDGRLVESDWDHAMSAVVDRAQQQLHEVGPSSLAFYTTGQLFLEEYYTLGLNAHGGIGTAHLDGNPACARRPPPRRSRSRSAVTASRARTPTSITPT